VQKDLQSFSFGGCTQQTEGCLTRRKSTAIGVGGVFRRTKMIVIVMIGIMVAMVFTWWQQISSSVQVVGVIPMIQWTVLCVAVRFNSEKQIVGKLYSTHKLS